MSFYYIWFGKFDHLVLVFRGPLQKMKKIHRPEAEISFSYINIFVTYYCLKTSASLTDTALKVLTIRVLSQHLSFGIFHYFKSIHYFKSTLQVKQKPTNSFHSLYCRTVDLTFRAYINGANSNNSKIIDLILREVYKQRGNNNNDVDFIANEWNTEWLDKSGIFQLRC